MNADREFFARVSDPCPVQPGQRIRLIAMGEDPDPIAPGTEGTVTGGNGSQIWVAWDNGRSLMLALPHDTYEVIP